MLAKPPSCHGCPMYQDGRGFVPDHLVDGVVTVVAQNPGKDEEAGRKIVAYQGKVPVYEAHPPAPLIGATGYLMEKDYFPLAGLERASTNLANILKCRLIVNGRRCNDMPKGQMLKDAVSHCTREHLRIPPTTKLIVAMGAYAWDYFGGPKTISQWRGFLKP